MLIRARGAELCGAIGRWSWRLPATDADQVERRPWAAVVADYVSLTKPRIMSLLLATEFLAMIVAARGWPGWVLTIEALGAGAMASGGASSINCWFDRDIDAVMGRTRGRPVPSGRIAPARALALGIGLSAVAFGVFAVGVNMLAAVLSLFGGAFYVLVYTMWLKRLTSQNIVIGGAAGAVPPLVGWAAVTHTVGPVALVLFGVIFLWTPPHFWALSLIVRRDYASVGVPMRPVVAGNRDTRRGIMVYSVLLVALSLTLAYWLGSAELAVGVVLGLIFLGLAGRVLLERGTTVWARRLFRFSLVYLFAFFLGTACVAVLGG